ncbi:hypothetical protein NV379_16665 [Paenibacillus sp. N1-5-1-14]|uniref:hypothetical protein n=1 Tax=Paenibacillus radicibacter TaxID=2972488 RepID=UPI00215957FA|nr:hypothetical protein [Paenibacillus radicibacter]MCR8644287.1 hypothetical protein [Paenibacillus radicibacter]
MSISIIRDRIVSSPSTTVVAIDRSTAISGLLNMTGTPATDVGRSFFAWPGLDSYSNDNYFTPVTPAFVWGDTVIPGERLGFAASSQLTGNPSASSLSIIVFLTVFCDNAHDVVIQLLQEGKPFPAVTITPVDGFNVPLPLIDGTMTPMNEPVAPPFNWQTLRFYSGTVDVEDSTSNYSAVVSFEGQNYLNQGSAPNPAGLAFVMDTYFIFEVFEEN